MKPFFCFLFCLQFSQAKPPKEIRDQYPFFRYSRTSFNLIFGGMSLWKGFEVMGRENLPREQENWAIASIGIGAIRTTDGLYFLINKTVPETLMDEKKLDKKNKRYSKYLRQAANFERRLRYYRGSVILLNGLTFFRLYDLDEEKNKELIVPAIGMMVVSTYALIFPGPAERLLKTQNNVSLSVSPNSVFFSYSF